MDTQLQIVSLLVSVGLFLLVFELVRRRRLLERYALLWLFTAVILICLSAWGDLLDRVSRVIGIGYGPSTLFAVALGFITILLLHFSIVISRIAEQNKILAQHVGLLQRRLKALEDGSAGDAGPGPAGVGTPAGAATDPRGASSAPSDARTPEPAGADGPQNGAATSSAAGPRA